MSVLEANKKKRERALELHKKFQSVRHAFRRHWTMYGEMAVEFEKGEYFKLLGFGSMKAYLKSLDKVCYSTIAEAMSVIKSLPEMDTKEMALYPKENLKILKVLPESKRKQKRVLDACRSLKGSEFRAFANNNFNTHLESKQRFSIDASPSQMTIYDGAIACCQEIALQSEEEANISRAEALEFICAEYLQRYGQQTKERVRR